MDARLFALPADPGPVSQVLGTLLVWCEVHGLPVRLLRDAVAGPLLGFWVLSVIVRGNPPRRRRRARVR